MSDNPQPEQRSPEWYKARIGRVTGSVAGAILGVDPNKSRYNVLRRMVRDHIGAEREDESEFLEDVIFGYGRMHESGALIDFKLDTGIDTEECGFFPYEDWLGASPDALTSDGGVLEIKAPWSRRTGQDREFKTLDEQPQYYAQMQIEMLCAGRDKAHIYQWSAEKQVHEIVPINRDWLNENLPALRQFHAEFLDALADPDEYLAPKRVVIDTPEAAKMMREWDELSEQIELATERKKDLLADIAALGKGKNALVAGRKVTLVEKAGSISYAKAIKSLLPDANLEKWRGKASNFWKVT